uniref:Uncharacterized protein n=1 Tax=Moschus moschiferus TaxID=68415 RepID=A0A8C6DWB2_MOSMO
MYYYLLALFRPDNIRWHSDNCVFVKKQLAQIRNTSQQMCFVKGYAKKLNREYFPVIILEKYCAMKTLYSPGTFLGPVFL